MSLSVNRFERKLTIKEVAAKLDKEMGWKGCTAKNVENLMESPHWKQKIARRLRSRSSQFGAYFVFLISASNSWGFWTK